MANDPRKEFRPLHNCHLMSGHHSKGKKPKQLCELAGKPTVALLNETSTSASLDSVSSSAPCVLVTSHVTSTKLVYNCSSRKVPNITSAGKSLRREQEAAM